MTHGYGSCIHDLPDVGMMSVQLHASYIDVNYWGTGLDV
jgi:hypothetical protein